MAKSRKRDPKYSLQAFRLVGKFLYRWGAIENLIATNIKNLLKMSGPEPDIILANVTFRDKAQILSTLIAVAYGKGDRKKVDQSIDLFTDILDFNTKYRNVLAHYPFEPKKTGIVIFRTQAKGRYSKNKTVWDSKFFDSRFSEIDTFERGIEAVIADLKQREGIKRIARALSSPISENASLDWLSRHIPHHPIVLGLGLRAPIVGTTFETPPPPRARGEDVS